MTVKPPILPIEEAIKGLTINERIEFAGILTMANGGVAVSLIPLKSARPVYVFLPAENPIAIIEEQSHFANLQLQLN